MNHDNIYIYIISLALKKKTKTKTKKIRSFILEFSCGGQLFADDEILPRWYQS